MYRRPREKHFKMRNVKGKEREAVRNMYDGRCAYCGKRLQKTFHVDHIVPVLRYEGERTKHAQELDALSNLRPACPRCNIWKHSMSVEEFRAEIAAQPERLLKRSAGFALAKDFKLVRISKKDVIFYFEKT